MQKPPGLLLADLPPSGPSLHVATRQDHEHIGPVTPGNRSNCEHSSVFGLTASPRPAPHDVAGLNSPPVAHAHRSISFGGFGEDFAELRGPCVVLRCFAFARFAFAVAVFATPISMR